MTEKLSATKTTVVESALRFLSTGNIIIASTVLSVVIVLSPLQYEVGPYPTAAARGAPRHDQRSSVRSTKTDYDVYVCTYTYYIAIYWPSRAHYQEAAT